ncbi:MAG: DUF11 domain-containing protein, partial [Verrucomicrobia bacterium]|nr:DUF11 domain-containing protein [Verrucomicrobiota bacterium]
VITHGGTNTSALTFTVAAAAPPAIGGFDPIAGQPGAKIAITGANLSGATQVKFNGTNAAFTIFAGTLVATVPANAATGPISVTTPGGTVTTMNDFFIGVFNDLALNTTGPTNTLAAGDAVIYYLTVTNLGPADATNVVVVNRLPVGMSSQFIFSKGGDCVESNGVVTCNFAKLASGGNTWIKIYAAVNTGNSFTNVATARADEFDPAPANNSVVSLNPVPVVIPPEPPSPPTLQIQALASSNIELAWPTNQATFVLESTPSLLPPVLWSTVSTSPVVTGGQNRVTLGALSGVKFFRLRTP